MPSYQHETGLCKLFLASFNSSFRAFGSLFILCASRRNFLSFLFLAISFARCIGSDSDVRTCHQVIGLHITDVCIWLDAALLLLNLLQSTQEMLNRSTCSFRKASAGLMSRDPFFFTIFAPWYCQCSRQFDPPNDPTCW